LDEGFAPDRRGGSSSSSSSFSSPLSFFINSKMGESLSKPQDEDGDRILVAGRPNFNRCDNMIVTSKYNAWTFLPVVRIV
jgi:hypothetical protein